VAVISATSRRASWAALSAPSPSNILSLICKMGLASLVTSRPPGTGAENGSSRAGLSSSPASGDCGTRCIDHGPVHTAHRATSRPRLLLLDLIVQEHLEDVEARE